MADNLLGDLFSQDSTVFVDGDTVKDSESGESIRFKGVDTREVSKPKNKDDWNEGVTFGQVGGQLASGLIQQLANKEGYTIPVGNPEERGYYGRILGDMENPQGESLTGKILGSGLGDISIGADKNNIAQALVGRLESLLRRQEGNPNDWDLAADKFNEQVNRFEELTAKPVAANEMQYALGKDFFAPNQVMIRSDDRTIDNKARNSLKTGFLMGISGVQEGAWGFWDGIDDTFGFDGGGKPRVERIKRELAELPILENQNAFDDNGDWRLDSATKVADWLITNAAASSPYIVGSILSVAAAPFTYGTSLAIPSVIYTGQTYNEQQDKDFGLALLSGVGQGTLDLLGLKGISSSAKTFLTDKALRAKVVEELAKKTTNGNLKQAEALLANKTMSQIAAVSKIAKDSLAKQFGNKYLGFAKDTGKAFVKGGASEGVTETLQELLAALGEKNFKIEDIDGQELTNRLLNAAVAGGALGGGIGSISQVKTNMNQLGALSSASNEIDQTKVKEDLIFREEAIREAGGDASQVSTEHWSNTVNDKNPGLDGLAGPELRKREDRGFMQTLKNAKEDSIPKLWKGFIRRMNDKYGTKSPNLRKAFGLLNGNDIGGKGIEDDQHMTEAHSNYIIGSEEQAIQDFKVKSIKDVTKIFSNLDIVEIYSNLKSELKYSNIGSISALFRSQGLSVPSEYKGSEQQILNYLDKIYTYDQRIEDLTGRESNLLKSKTFDKVAIQKNLGEFVEALQEVGFTEKQAEDLSLQILDKQIVQSSEDLFDDNLFDMESFMSENSIKPSEVDLNKLYNKNNSKLNQFLNSDMFYNIAKISGTSAASYANRKYLGKDGYKIAHYINEALKKGEIKRDEAAYIAAEIKDYIAIRKNEYKRIENKAFRAFQENAIFLTLINQLPLSSLSSLVELSLVRLGVPQQALFGKGFLVEAAKKAGYEIFDLANWAGSGLSRGAITRKNFDQAGRGDLARLGFLQGSQSVAQQNDINSGNKKQKAIDTFFKIVGLQSLTNFTRNLRLGLAMDAINGFIFDVEYEGIAPTKQSMSSREALLELAIDPDFVIKYNNTPESQITNDMREKYQMMMDVAMYRFVNQAVAHPTKSNRPKMYQNPRTALFFQFQGYMSAFTANILPRIYRQMFNGNVPMDNRMNAIGTVLTLLFVGFISQYLRDLVKYGEESPYLDEWGVIRRAVNASGIMGTGERVVNTMFPLYDTSHDNWLDFALDEISGQAPVLGYGGKVADAVESLVTQDRYASRLQKIAPFTGPVNQMGWALDDLFK